jgi:uncharacterized protein (TIGR03083 family)
MEERKVFLDAASWCIETVALLPDDAWQRPGLGDWDVRSLVGHTSRSFTTVVNAINTPAATEELATAEEYFLTAAKPSKMLAEAVRDRGFAAGRDLGARPGERFRELFETTQEAIENTGNPLVTSLLGGIRLNEYLRTRTFELVVHGLDIQHALTTPDSPSPAFAPPPVAALTEAVTLVQRLAILRGDGSRVLLAMTGRSSLPDNYSVLA